MKKHSNLLLMAVAGMTLLTLMAGCTQSELLIDEEQQALQAANRYRITFGEAFPENATRTSKASSSNGTGFEVGDVMAIYGYQYNPDGYVDEIFSNTAVTKQADGQWTYEETKYWNPGSQYAFFGIYPKDDNLYTFDKEKKFFTVPNFVVAEAKDDQRDLMIAKMNETAPVNSVDMVFNHLLCNVNFYFKVQDKFYNSGIASYEVVNFEVTGLKGSGSYVQTAFDANLSAVGEWQVNDGVAYPYPTVTEGSIVKGQVLSLGDDLLMIPQALSDDAIASLTYRLVYADGTSCTLGPRTFALNKVRGLSRLSNDMIDMVGWEANSRYNYYLAVNPSIRTNPTVDYDGGLNGYDTPTGTIRTLDADDPANPYNDPDSPYYRENNTEEFWYVDVDGEDGDYNPEVDYPIIWVDIDGVIVTDENGVRHTTLEAVVDKNRNGIVDAEDCFDNDGVNYAGVPDNEEYNPYHLDVILQDIDGDGVADTPLQRDGTQLPPDKPFNADVDGSVDGDGTPTGYLDSLDPDDPNNPYNDPDSPFYQEDNDEPFFFVDTDGDGEYDPETDYPIVWKDIDGDGKEEGIVDWNRNGEVDEGDNKDGDHTDYNGNPDNEELNPEGVDVVLIPDPNNPTQFIELEREPGVPPVVIKWDNADANGAEGGYQTPLDHYVLIAADAEGNPTPGEDFPFIDVDKDGAYNPDVDYPIVWKDLDGTVYTNADGSQYTTLEGIVDVNRNGVADAGDRVDNDGQDYLGRPDNGTLNPDHLDVITLDYDGDHVAETPLTKKMPVAIDEGTEIHFTADVDTWSNTTNGTQNIRN